jgi:N-methylhydantoinase A
MGWRLGIDVGGTFTDFVAAPEVGGAPVTWKQPSDAADPAAAVLRGVPTLLERAGIAPDDVSGVVHGATLALNTVIERQGAKVGLVVSEGYGDILTLRRGGLPHSYNYKAPKPVPLVPRHRVHEIPARLRPDGSPVLTPSDGDIDRVAQAVRTDEVTALAVLVVNSYANPRMEIDLAEAIGARLPGILVSASAQLWPEIREFERALVTVMNGYIHPLMDRYYLRLGQGLQTEGIAAPLDIATSTGGVIGVAIARERPVETLLSGPAAGVAAAARFASAAGVAKAISFDMGGTSSDIAVILDGQPELAAETSIEDHPLILPVIAVSAIGAGGGSTGWVDPQGLLKVGPGSAGADPGPACYGRGGTDATVTDAWLALGCIHADHFLGGRMVLDRAAACEALTRLGAGIGIDGTDTAERTAFAMLRIATARMATEIGKALAQRGLDPAEFTLIAYGGAGPAQAATLAEAARLPRILIPPGPATFCAFGAVSSGLRRDFSRSRRLSLGEDEGAEAAIATAETEMRAEAADWAALEGRHLAEATVSLTADMQYPRTAVELSVATPAEPTAETLTALFHEEHERLYGFRDTESPVHVTILRLSVRFPSPDVSPDRQQPGQGGLVRHRAVMWRDEPVDTPVFTLPLALDTRVTGPAVLEMEDSSVLVPPGWSLGADRSGGLELTQQGES